MGIVRLEGGPRQCDGLLVRSDFFRRSRYAPFRYVVAMPPSVNCFVPGVLAPNVPIEKREQWYRLRDDESGVAVACAAPCDDPQIVFASKLLGLLTDKEIAALLRKVVS